MIEKLVNGKKKLCFLVKNGDVADIVIPVDSLIGTDYKRFQNMEAQGGEMMRVMRDTTLDNGLNALVTYQDLLVIIPKDGGSVKENVTNNITEETNDVVDNKPRRGRPKGSKNKAKD